MTSNTQRPTPGGPKRPYGKIAALVLIPVLVVAIAAVAIIGPSRVATLANQVNRMGGASAGNLASFSGARDTRFGIAEGAKHPDTKATGIGWERQTFSWSGIQPNGPDDWNADFYAGWLQGELDTGVQVVGLLQFTPGWARANPGVEQRSLPQNLSLPYNDPNNYWGRYTRRIAEHYRGRINHWVIWNEPEIRPTDAGAGSAWTFDGGPEEYAQLLKVAYHNIKEANPDATVVFAGTAYWLDKNSGREQFFKRVLDVIANDPEAGANNWYFDAVAYNIYYGADTIYRVGLETRAIMAARGINKEMWLTETNAPPSDPGVPCADRFAANPSSVSLDVHSNYAMQSMAMGLAGGWSRVEWYQSTDSGSCNESAIWGLLRDDGSRRPAFDSFSTAIRQLNGVGNLTFMPYEREVERWGQPWPYNPESYFPNYQVYQVVGDRGDQRISVLWNADGAPLQARIPKQGSSAVLIDQFGGETPLSDNAGWYMVDLPQATARSASDPDGYYYIGGQTRIIVQSGVPGGTAMLPPALGAPGSQPREFTVSVSPENGQKISAGQSTQFTLRMRSFEGFSDPVSISVQEYSNAGDRTPTGLPGYISLDMPASVQPNGRVDIQVHMAPDAPSNLHFMTLKIEGGGISKTVDLVVEVP